MVKSERTLLKEELESNFLALLVRTGWSLAKRPEKYDSPELRRAFPFGTAIRTIDNRAQMVDIQFDKRGRARFRIIIGTLPKEGLPSIVDSSLVPVEGLSAQLAPDAHVVRPSVILFEWFGFWPWQRKDKFGAAKIVSELILKWDDAESFFLTGKKGRHLQKWPK
jgi:hypothetical protein